MTESLQEKTKKYLFSLGLWLIVGLFLYGVIWLSTYRYRECREFKHSILYCLGR